MGIQLAHLSNENSQQLLQYFNLTAHSNAPKELCLKEVLRMVAVLWLIKF